ncbi:hypothetical protein JCM10003_1352 [Bacteroides pyogenes JCM 10003]|nr:hypothetical protein [Bacteroides pyogenes]GAE21844.1 hypothetical protein JCM10003_1352 [Bacteroides pyogenes JCM 10003]
MLQSREKPETQEQLAKMGVSFEDFLPRQKNATAIDPEKVDCCPVGDTTIYTEARLAFRTDDNGNIGLAVHSMRKES